MKTIFIISAIATGLLMFSTMVCGLWLRYSGQEIAKSSLDLHLVIGLATAAATLATIVLAFVKS